MDIDPWYIVIGLLVVGAAGLLLHGLLELRKLRELRALREAQERRERGR